jgi:hypothetical protein
MARASYVYVIIAGIDGSVQRAFTVKHECRAFLERHLQQADEEVWRVWRVKDGDSVVWTDDYLPDEFAVREFLTKR